MPITREILNVQADHGEDVTIYRPKFSEWEVVGNVLGDSDTEKSETVYQIMSGDPEYPGRMRLGVYHRGQNADGRTSTSAKFSTYVKTTDDDGNITYEPIDYVCAITGPFKQNLSGTDSIQAIYNMLVFAGFLPELTTPLLQATPKTVSVVQYNRLKFGITEFNPADRDDPAAV